MQQAVDLMKALYDISYWHRAGVLTFALAAIAAMERAARGSAAARPRGVREQLKGYDARFYCAGISSMGMSEADYAVVTYGTPVAFAKTLLELNPGMSFIHISGRSTQHGRYRAGQGDVGAHKG